MEHDAGLCRLIPARTQHRGLARSDTWGRSCRKADGSQTQHSESVSAHSLQMHSGPLYSQPVSTRRLGILPLLLAETVVFETAQEKGHAHRQQLVILPRLLAEKLSCNLANLTRCTRGRLGPQQRVGQSGSTSLPQPSGRAVCLALKRKRTFAPSSGSEGASAELKPIKASCEKRRGEGREMLIIMTRKNAI